MKRDIDSLLNYEAKRRPEIAAMMADLGSYSEAEIQQLSVMKWIRDALLRRRRLLLADQIATDAFGRLKIIDGFTSDPLGETRRWIGIDTYLNVDRGGGLEIRSNRLLWLPCTGGVWFESAFSRTIDQRIHTTSFSLGVMTKTAYSAAYKELAVRNCPTDAPVIFSDKDASNPLTIAGVRFFKPGV